jgi:hypothetical protein
VRKTKMSNEKNIEEKDGCMSWSALVIFPFRVSISDIFTFNIFLREREVGELVDIIYSLPLYEKINNVTFRCLKNNFIRQKFLYYYIHTLFIYTFTISILTVYLFLFSSFYNVIIVIRNKTVTLMHWTIV